LNGCHYLSSRDVTPTTGNAIFEQRYNVGRGHVCVKLPGNPEQPAMHAITGSWWVGQ
jgi:hypothetical protein